MEIVDFLNPENSVRNWTFNKDEAYFIVMNETDSVTLGEKINLELPSLTSDKKSEPEVRFASLNKIDRFSFVYYQLKESNFLFETFSLYYNANLFIVSVNKKGDLHEAFFNYFIPKMKAATPGEVYLHFLEEAIYKMFNSLYEFEEILSSIENELIQANSDYGLGDIIKRKNEAFKVKKYMRLMQYVSDDLMLNLNNFIPKNELRFFKSLDNRINRVYDFSVSLFETCTHLLEIYDSTVTTKTNDTINKLTVFTVFATPITVISGIYGMNFVNIPELRDPNGYYIVLGIMLATMIIIYLILKKIKLL